MTGKSCRHYIGELERFFRWLHLSATYPLRKPEDYELIKKKPDELDENIEAAGKRSRLTRSNSWRYSTSMPPLSSGSSSCWASTVLSVPTSRDG